MMAPAWSSTGLISVYFVLPTFSSSFFTSSAAAFLLYVTQTAPCSSECTAFTSAMAFL